MKNFISTLFFAMGISVAFAQLPSSLPTGGMGGGMGDVLGTFMNDGLSPDAFKDDFDAGGLLKSAGDIADVASLGTHVNKLIGGIKPGMFKKGVDVNQLLDMANSAKSIADATGLLKKLDKGLLSSAFKGDWNKKRPAWKQALKALG